MRPVTLFTGQWADLPFDEVCRLAAEWGYDGLEIACSADHFEVGKALANPGYVRTKRETLDRHGLQVFTISNHLVGQAVCDHPIDERHRAILPPRIWGDGEPEGVRQRAAAEMADTARAAALLGVNTVVGFTGSGIWHTVAMFPPVPPETIARGYQDFADRWNPILDVFDTEGVRFAHEVHPSEIAYDYWTTERALQAVDHRSAFGLNWDPSHFLWQDLDPVTFILDFADRIYHVDCKDTKVRCGDGRRGRLSSHCPGAICAAAGTSCPPATATCHGRTPSAPQRHRLHRPDLDRMGGRGHGPVGRSGRGSRLRPPNERHHSPIGGLRRGIRYRPALSAGV
jgi:sugar phosphate isomerase/epimerase